MLRSCVVAFAVLSVAAAPVTRGGSASPERYVSAVVDSAGRLSIVTADHRTITPEPDSAQVGVERVAISHDRRAVGWLAMFPNCCTSYPIPLALKVYAGGRLHTFIGWELPVWQWRFEAGSSRVSFHQETVHGGFGIHYELHDLRTERLLESYDLDTTTVAPAWVVRLDEAPAGEPR
jgi:hypothetical protein